MINEYGLSEAIISSGHVVDDTVYALEECKMGHIVEHEHIGTYGRIGGEVIKARCGTRVTIDGQGYSTTDYAYVLETFINSVILEHGQLGEIDMVMIERDHIEACAYFKDEDDEDDYMVVLEVRRDLYAPIEY